MAITSALDLVKNAKANIENLTPQQVAEELKNGKAILVDIRETHELSEQGKILGSVNAPRGMLEFYADPSLPYHKATSMCFRRTICPYSTNP